MNEITRPPKYALKFLEWFCPAELHEGIEGDLLEDFILNIKVYGIKKARIKFIVNVFSFFRPGVLFRNKVNMNTISLIMLKNYLTIGFRNILKYKAFSFINISGMIVSLSLCMLIYLFVTDELSYDRYHPGRELIFRVYDEVKYNDGAVTHIPIVPYPFASFMQKDFPEIESTLRISDTYGEQLFEEGGKKMMENHGIYAEPGIFNMLTIKVLTGKDSMALSKPNSVALSRTLAMKYFEKENPVGELIKISGTDYLITAVFADPPEHFHLNLNYIISFASITQNWGTAQFENWRYQQFFTYIKIRPNSMVTSLEEKLIPFVEKYAYPVI
jgi:putative ABC transport system permease protein